MSSAQADNMSQLHVKIKTLKAENEESDKKLKDSYKMIEQHALQLQYYTNKSQSQTDDSTKQG